MELTLLLNPERRKVGEENFERQELGDGWQGISYFAGIPAIYFYFLLFGIIPFGRSVLTSKK